MTEGAYAVVLAGPEQFRPAEIVRVLAALRGVPAIDLQAGVRKSWGLLGLDLSEAEARAWASALGQAGIKAKALPQALVEDPPPAQAAARLDYSPEGLMAEADGRPRRVAWEGMALLAAGGWVQTTQAKAAEGSGPKAASRLMRLGLLAAGIPLPKAPEPAPEPPRETRDLVHFLDVVLAEPALRLRVDAQGFDYSCLKARKVYDAFGNFKQLLGDLVDLAPRARRSRGAELLLAGKPVREAGYEGLADLEREERWLLTLRALQA